MNPNTPFRKIETSPTEITYYGKKDATWKEMDDYLERMWGDDPHWKWRGFGTAGTEEFMVVLLRMECNEDICECEDETEGCELCGNERDDEDVGCCEGTADGKSCMKRREKLCTECAVWDEEEGVWRCPDCA